MLETVFAKCSAPPSAMSAQRRKKSFLCVCHNEVVIDTFFLLWFRDMLKVFAAPTCKGVVVLAVITAGWPVEAAKSETVPVLSKTMFLSM